MWDKYEPHPIDTCYSNHVATWIFNAWKLTNVCLWLARTGCCNMWTPRST